MSVHFLKTKFMSLFIILIVFIAVSIDCLAQNRIDELMRVTDQGDFDEFTSFMDEVRNRQLINMPDSSGSTALMVASYKEHRDIVNFLLREGADIDKKNNNGTTALMAAVGQSNEEVVQILLDRGADPNIRNNDGDTALMIAIRHEQIDVIDDLLLAGAYLGGMDIYNAENSDLHLELMMISTIVHRFDVVQYLLEEGIIDVNAQTEAGVTTLMVASMYNATSIARYLLDKGAEPNIPDSDGNTALMSAVTGPDKIEIVNVLLEAGANPNVLSRNDTNETNDGIPEWMLRNENQDNSVTLLMLASVNCDNLDIVNRLLEAGADPYGQNRSGETALSRMVLVSNHNSYNCLIMAERLLAAMKERYIPPPPPRPPFPLPLPWQR